MTTLRLTAKLFWVTLRVFYELPLDMIGAVLGHEPSRQRVFEAANRISPPPE